MKRRILFLLLPLIYGQVLFSQSLQSDLKIYLFGFHEGKTYQLQIENAQGDLIVTKQVDTDELVLSQFDLQEFRVEVYADGKQLSTQYFQLQANQRAVVIYPGAEEHFALSEVFIEAERKTLDVKSDRIVYNLESSAFQKGFNSMEVLEKVPFVRVVGGDISIIGKGKTTITINDKKVHFTGTQLQAYLETIPSERIKKIEVITNPPTKYSSYGNGGVINIQLKPSINESYAILLSSAFTQRQHSNYRNNASFNYHGKKWNLDLNLNYAREKRKYEDYSRFANAGNLLRESRKSVLETEHQFLATTRADYQVNNMTNLGLVYTYTRFQADDETNRQTFFPENGILLNLLYGDARTQKNVINLYADIKLDTLDSKLSFLGTYISNEAEEHYESTSFQFENEKQQKNNIYEFKALLETPLSETAKIDLGFNLNKATDFVINRDGFKEGQTEFHYNEFTYDLFFDFYWDLGETFTLSGGFKYEGWERQIETIDIHEDFIFPTFNLAYKRDSKNNFTLSYSKRMVKPYLSYLDPYKVYTAPSTYSVGNPYLNPYTIHNLEFRYTYERKLFFTIYSQNYDELFGTVTKLIDGNQVETKENYYDSQQYGAIISYFYRDLDWWNFQLVNHTFYQIPKDLADDFISFEGITSAFFVTSHFYLKPDKSTVPGFNYIYNLPGKTANGKYNTFATFNLSFKTPIVQDLLQMKFSVVDIFDQQYRKGELIFPMETFVLIN